MTGGAGRCDAKCETTIQTSVLKVNLSTKQPSRERRKVLVRPLSRSNLGIWSMCNLHKCWPQFRPRRVSDTAQMCRKRFLFCFAARQHLLQSHIILEHLFFFDDMRRLLDLALHRRNNNSGSASASNIMASQTSPQTHFALFRILPVEIQFIIHEAVLADSTRLLHLISYRGSERKKHMGHWHCSTDRILHIVWRRGPYLGRMTFGPPELGHWHYFDTDCLFPTWQHP